MHNESKRQGYTDRHGAHNEPPEKRLFFHLNGACGELAFCIMLGVPWPAHVNVGKEVPDVPPDWQIKTRSNHNYELLVRTDDEKQKHHRYVLITGTAPVFVYRGWMRGIDAMQDKYWKDPNGRGPAWFVPQSDLIFDITQEAPAKRYQPAFTEQEKKTEWKYRFEERLGILCQGAEPTPTERVIATKEANDWLKQIEGIE